MAKITYGSPLGNYGEIEDFYDGPLQLQAGKSSNTNVIYKDTGADHNKISITGTGLEWTGDFITAGNITGVAFTTKEGDPYLTIKGGQYTVEEFNNAYSTGGIAGVETLLLRGADTITGSKISDTIHSGDKADVVHGGNGADSIDGGSGRDRLFGDAGKDYIFGGTGVDRMTGGAGSDHFHFSSGNGKDVITDFDAKGGGDNQDYLSLYRGDAFTIEKVGNNTVLDFGDGDTLTLLDVRRADFNRHDIDWLAS